MSKRLFFVISVLLLNFLFVVSAFAMSNEEFFKICENGNIKQIKAAIAKGADVNAKDKDGLTTLDYVRANKNSDIIKELMKADAK
ncbi:ankyrin repeat domain-containing protein [Desulfovibrio litoralis]|uniref:Ankyrin repeats (3 copies) n=1 Tax=Desulfovibrio litoralis DSM 11393 TaxID=1121455 RepID=A0A1M7SG99_9BACT|nr:ankyrin repeat domain-containing protein [Desulfovibrio litoralis]SHN57503.1 Ankyrin repeats (3 copies) [Desulfovibrio litoralis DSM 11393]